MEKRKHAEEERIGEQVNGNYLKKKRIRIKWKITEVGRCCVLHTRYMRNQKVREGSGGKKILPESQGGFRSGGETIDNVFTWNHLAGRKK